MKTLIPSQIRDALAYIDGLEKTIATLSDEPGVGQGMRLWLPAVIPLSPDYEGERPVAWLIANDFNGYDLTTEEPSL